ncbi:MAG: dihydroorotate dehydrogenase [Planctomycetota bacterium]
MTAAVKLGTRFLGVAMNSPVLTASGTSGFGEELKDFGDLSLLGGVVAKTVTPLARRGNPMPRISETPMGMINAIGLENVGIDRFLVEVAPRFLELPCPSIMNIAGFTVEEYGMMAEKVDPLGFDIIEINGSCPNVEAGGRVFCDDPKLTAEVTRAVRSRCKAPIMMKLSPNVSNIVAIAKAAVDAGADGLSLINTLVGTSVDWRKKRRGTAFGTGGLSGPAVKPVALRMVDQVCAALPKTPVCAIGGVSSAEDVCEFLALGAQVVQVGTALFRNPAAAFDIVADLPGVLAQAGYDDVNKLIGVMR